MKRVLSIVILGLVVASAAAAARSDFPQPKALEADVEFWKRIYSEVGTDGGLIHDTHDLSLVYEVVRFPSRQGAERLTEARKRYYQSILRTLAAGKREGLSHDEKRVLALFGRGVTNSELRLASERIRFQLGQADKFRAGVIRSGAYMDHIVDILRDMNLPLEIAHLPHVESSFTPNIYSRVGAAGLWQFTSATGRRFMRVDDVVDERLDPYRASVAAARLLEQNYRVTGSWPLAITAYNHGASGMRRAALQLGTQDIARIVREYRSPTFGFASRNFYVEFLAASHVATNHEDYFGKLVLDEPVDFDSIALPFYARSRDLANALGVDVATLERANPALRPGVWRNTHFVPRGYRLHVPTGAVERPLSQALASIPNSSRYASQPTSATYVVRRGDTLSTIARRHGTSSQQLAALNGLRRANSIRVGQRLKLPTRHTIAPLEPAPQETMVAAAPPERPAPAPTPTLATEPEREPTPVLATADELETKTETETELYTVRRGDSLTRIARAHGVSVAELAALNRLDTRRPIKAGESLRVVKPSEAAGELEPRTPSAPEALVAEAEPKPGTEPTPVPATADEPEIETELYTVRRGDSLTRIARAHGVSVAELAALNRLDTRRPIKAGEKLRVLKGSEAPPEVASAAPPPAKPAPAVPARPTPAAEGEVEIAAANANPEVGAVFDPNDESATDPSPGLLADPSDYTIANDRTIIVQPNETLGHYAEWLGVRASRLRQLNGMRYGEPVVVHQKLKLDFSNVPPQDFERVRVEYHRQLQEDFFAEWEIEGTSIHKVGPGDSIWKLSTRQFAVPIWLLRQYNPDVDLDSLSAGTQITVPKLRQRGDETSARDVVGRTGTAG